MATVKIFKIERAQTFRADELGTGYSLQPWGDNTSIYSGTDDGGCEYILPDGFEIAMSDYDTVEIYDSAGNHCVLSNNKWGKPIIVTRDFCTILKKVTK